jgi:hypothetical protein
LTIIDAMETKYTAMENLVQHLVLKSKGDDKARGFLKKRINDLLKRVNDHDIELQKANTYDNENQHAMNNAEFVKTMSSMNENCVYKCT